ncbi:MAG: ComEC/Rec2 family competence protein, partial [Candidatus Krumholzibacteriota bacterium]|nr:ComEC/Rec2 family competence protein [Candidatus Krumholzibacteriota bacterium]
MIDLLAGLLARSEETSAVAHMRECELCENHFRLLGRERACLNWISASAIVLAFVNPAMVFDVGFQLSFAAVLGVSYLSPALLEAVPAMRRTYERIILKYETGDEDRRLKKSMAPSDPMLSPFLIRPWYKLRRYPVTGLAITFAAWFAGLPILVSYFLQMHPWGPLSSLVVFPLVSIVMGLGFVKLVVGALSSTFGSLITGPLTTIDSLLIWIVEHFASLPGATFSAAAPQNQDAQLVDAAVAGASVTVVGARAAVLVHRGRTRA